MSNAIEYALLQTAPDNVRIERIEQGWVMEAGNYSIEGAREFVRNARLSGITRRKTPAGMDLETVGSPHGTCPECGRYGTLYSEAAGVSLVDGVCHSCLLEKHGDAIQEAAGRESHANEIRQLRRQIPYSPGRNDRIREIVFG